MPKPTPEAEEWIAKVRFTADLIGEPRPVICSCCIGSRWTRGILGPRRCVQCEGVGLELVGPFTLKWINGELDK